MSEYTATVSWRRGESMYTDNRYSRAHTWSFDGGVRCLPRHRRMWCPFPFRTTPTWARKRPMWQQFRRATCCFS